MKIERTKNATRNIVYGIINQGLTVLLPFIVRTIMIKVLGSEYLGLSSLCTAILQVLNMAELGFSSAIVFSMYKPIAEDDTTTICALMNLYRKVYRIIGFGILATGIVLTPFLKLLIKGDIPADINIYIIFLIYLVHTSLSYLLFAYKSALLSAHQRNDILSNINTLIILIQYTAQSLVLIYFKDYYLYVIFIPLCTLLTNLITAHITMKRYPHYICHGSLDQTALDDIKKKVGGLVIQKICVTTRSSINSITISTFIGLSTVAMFDNYYYIIRAVIGILVVFTTAISAGIGNSIAVDSVEKNHRDLHKFMFIYAWLAGWFTVCLFCLYQHFMKLWVGESLMFPISIVAAFCAYFYCLSIGDIRGLYITGAGLWWEGRFRSIIESVLNIALNIILAKYFGVLGVISATLISLLSINFGYGSHIVFKYYFKNNKLAFYFSKHGIYAINTFIICAITFWICTFVKDQGLAGFFLKIVICTIMPNIMYFLIYQRNLMFLEAIDLFKRITKLKQAMS